VTNPASDSPARRAANGPTTSSPARPGAQSPARRPTIVDVARAAGVSTAVVSYALNGRPGVSAATRERVLRVADEFGWRPSAAARSMRTGSRAVGLVLDRSAVGTPAEASGGLEFVVALQEVLVTRDLALVLQVVDGPEAASALYAEWWAERRFDVMVVTEALEDDPRVDALRKLRAPAVVVGGAPGVDDNAVAAATVGDGEAMVRVGRYLLELGHRQVALVTGPADRHQTHVRAAALGHVLRTSDGSLLHEVTDGSPEAAAGVTRRLLTGGQPPTALVVGTDQMAVAALDVARRSGVSVPWDLSLVSANDSALCRLATPSITALPSVSVALGTATGQVVLDVLDGAQGPRRDVPVGALAVRGSSGPRTG